LLFNWLVTMLVSSYMVLGVLVRQEASVGRVRRLLTVLNDSLNIIKVSVLLHCGLLERIALAHTESAKVVG